MGLLNGPNLNLLGRREPEVYGSTTFSELLDAVGRRADELGLALDAFQSNHEGALIDRLQEWSRDPALIGAIVNPGGLAHSSVVLRDAAAALGRPVVEVHLTNVAAREPFRRRSLLSGVARAVVSGLGVQGYLAALEFLAELAARPSGQR